MNIDNENKLIADFMQLSYKNDVWYFPDAWRLKGVGQWSTHLHFNDSWDWLIPVMEKICRQRIGDGVEYVDYSYPRTFGMLNKETGKIMVRLNGHSVFEADTLIDATWLSIVDFIKFQNTK